MNFVASLTADGQSSVRVGNTSIFNLNVPGAHNSEDESSLKGDDSSLLGHLYVTDPFNDLQSLKRRRGNRVVGTCEWIFTTERLRKWMDSPSDCCSAEAVSQVLWLHGSPGQGKSTMATYIIETLSTSFLTDSKKALSYFLCDSQYATRATSQSILRGLLWYFYSSYPELIPEYARRRYHQLNKMLFDDFDHLWTLLMETAKANVCCHLYCIIDAIDECDEESRDDLLRQIEEVFLSTDRPSNIKLLIISRPYIQIRDYLGQFENQDLASFPQLKQDINLYIDYKLDKLANNKRYSRVLREKINSALRSRAEDTFLWVGLACWELRRIASVDVLKFLDRLPRELEAFYSGVFDSILGPDAPEAADTEKILCFVATSLRPLTLLELSEACGFDTKEDRETRTQYMRDRVEKCLLIIDIVTVKDDIDLNKRHSWSIGSIAVSQLESERVVLLHQTVKDYIFTSLRGQLNGGERNLHAITTYRCLDELMNCLSENRGFLHPGSFLQYAIYYWPRHARLAQASFEVQDIHASFFSDPSPVRDEWLEQRRQHADVPLINIWHSIEERLPLLNVAALWGIPSLIEYVSERLHQGIDIDLAQYNDEEFSRLKSPLTDAVQGGCIHTFRKLLHLGLPLTELTIESAASHERGDILHTLLQARRDEIAERPCLQRSAAEYFNGSDLLLLMDHPDFKISEPMLHGVMANQNLAPEVLGLMLAQSGMEPKSLLEQTITESSTASITSLLDIIGNDLKADATLVAKAAENCQFGADIVDLLVQRFPDVNITDEIILSILDLGELGAQHVYDVLKVLFERLRPKPRVTRPVLLGAARAELDDDEEAAVFGLVLEHAGDDIQITEDIVMAAAQNSNASEAIPLLLKYREAEINITEEVLCAAIPKHHRRDFIVYLQQQSVFVSRKTSSRLP